MQEASDANRRLTSAPGANGVPAESVSPSLCRDGGRGAAYELKFLITRSLAERVDAWARQRLALDAHADPALDSAYRIHSLYLDTPALDVYHRSPGFSRRKFRVRRYGDEPRLFLERKTKTAERVRKRRTVIEAPELDRLRNGADNPEWAGHWFHSRLATRGLQPTCQITYDRVAHVGSNESGPLRLTLDHGIHCGLASDWQIAEPHSSRLLLPDQVVLELKFRTVLPLLFKQLVQEIGLNPQPVSKYRLCIEAWALQEAAKEAG